MAHTTTAPSAAKRLKRSDESVRSWCRRGFLGRKVLGRWQVDVDELERVERGEPPRPLRLADVDPA